MTHVIAEKFCVGLRWEPLLGLEREVKEIRTLLARRAVSRYAIYEGEMGARSLGLAPAELAADATQRLYALLCLLGATLKQKSFLFVHPHPDDESKMILAGVRDDRPELDGVFDTAQASAAVGSFLAAGSLSGIVVAGAACAHLPTLAIEHVLPLSDLLAGAAKRDLERIAITSMKPLVSRRMKGSLAAVLAVAVITFGLLALQTGHEEVSETPTYNLAESFQNRLNQALLAETSHGGTHFVQAVESTVRSIPVDVHGWRAMRIDCGDSRCVVSRHRQTGADTTALLDEMQNVKLEGLDRAVENVPLFLQRPAAGDVQPISETAFSARTAARMQQLGDLGMAPKLTLASPIIPVPDAMSSAASINIIKRGVWSLAGDLAFLDSLTTLIAQSGNMVLKGLHIDLAAPEPSFNAEGYYYVD